MHLWVICFFHTYYPWKVSLGPWMNEDEFDRCVIAKCTVPCVCLFCHRHVFPWHQPMRSHEKTLVHMPYPKGWSFSSFFLHVCHVVWPLSKCFTIYGSLARCTSFQCLPDTPLACSGGRRSQPGRLSFSFQRCLRSSIDYHRH